MQFVRHIRGVLSAMGDRRRRRILQHHAIADEIWARTVADLDLLAHLGANEKQRLRELTTLFLHDKRVYGAHGLVVDDGMRTAIAAQACLLVLNLGLGYYRDWHTVLLYEGAFIAHHEYEDEAGIVHEVVDALDGETSLEGPVVLSWEEADPAAHHGVERGELRDDKAPMPEDAENITTIEEIHAGNVVLHELAHKLDYLNGDANGFPPLHPEMPAQAWSSTFSRAYDQLCEALDRDKPTAIDPYAAENPAEFFAVTTELFFVDPARLLQALPDVYQQLALFYRQNPAARSRSEATP